MLLKYFYLIIIYMYIKKNKQIMLKVNQSAEPVISIAMGYQAKPKMKLPILAILASPSSNQNPIWYFHPI